MRVVSPVGQGRVGGAGRYQKVVDQLVRSGRVGRWPSRTRRIGGAAGERWPEGPAHRFRPVGRITHGRGTWRELGRSKSVGRGRSVGQRGGFVLQDQLVATSERGTWGGRADDRVRRAGGRTGEGQRPVGHRPLGLAKGAGRSRRPVRRVVSQLVARVSPADRSHCSTSWSVVWEADGRPVAVAAGRTRQANQLAGRRRRWTWSWWCHRAEGAGPGTTGQPVGSRRRVGARGSRCGPRRRPST
jgi:hypothetical protein